jgi:hypothetical protein
MAWFSKKPAAPEISRQEIDRYGRHKIKVIDSADWSFAADLEMRAYQWGQADSAGFMAGMVLASEGGEWAAFGAGRLQIEALGFQRSDPQFDTVMHHSINFLRSRGVPRIHLTGYENSWWVDNSGGEPWLVGRPMPEPDAAPITPLDDGELRRIAYMGPEGNDNNILITRADAGYKAIIEGKNSDEDPRLMRNEWMGMAAPTLYELFVRLGDALITPKPWMHHELVPYIPLPAPDFS